MLLNLCLFHTLSVCLSDLSIHFPLTHTLHSPSLSPSLSSSPQIGVRLTEVVSGSSTQRTLLAIAVEQMRADVVDRSWDTQGTVTIGNVSMLDHISLGEICVCMCH